MSGVTLRRWRPGCEELVSGQRAVRAKPETLETWAGPASCTLSAGHRFPEDQGSSLAGRAALKGQPGRPSAAQWLPCPCAPAHLPPQSPLSLALQTRGRPHPPLLGPSPRPSCVSSVSPSDPRPLHPSPADSLQPVPPGRPHTCPPGAPSASPPPAQLHCLPSCLAPPRKGSVQEVSF